MLLRRTTAILLVLCLTHSPESAVSQPKPRFLLISTLRGSTFERELKEAAAAGYQVLFAVNRSYQGTAGALPQAFAEGNQLILEKRPEDATKVEYLFLKQRGDSAQMALYFLEQDMNEAAAKGARFRARTFLGLMERREGAGATPPPKYRVLEGSSKLLQEQICEVSKEGFRFVDLLGNVVVMEKPGDATKTAGAGCPYLILGARTESRLRKELAAAVAGGHRAVAAAAPGEIIIVMEKVASGSSGFGYLILDSMRIGKLRRDIEGEAAKGCRAASRTFIHYSVVNLVLMEKGPAADGLLEYRILQGNSSKLQKELIQTAEQGFRPVAMNDSTTLLLERPRP